MHDVWRLNGTWGYEVDIFDSLEALFKMLLNSLGIPRLAQNLQKIIVGHEVKPRENHPGENEDGRWQGSNDRFTSF